LLRDGEISSMDRRELIRTRTELGLDRADAQQVLRRVVMESDAPVTPHADIVCPRCGMRLDRH
jgi:hypothetical protein